MDRFREAATNPQCLAATSLAFANVAGDATTLLGVGAIVRAGALAYGSGQVATTLAREGVVRELAPGAIQQSQAFVTQGLDTAARTVLGDVGTSAATNTAGAYQGTDVSVWDFVPVIASVRAIEGARNACGG